MNAINQVLQTNDYSLFSSLKGNRIVNELHVERLKKSFGTTYLLSPIIVNGKHEIIDGQHRFAAAKKLNLPINYIVVEGYGLEEVQLLNTNTKNWKKLDYLHAYCDLGYEEYLKMKKFMEDFPEFGISCCEALLTNKATGVNGVSQVNVNGKKKGRVKNFQEGRLTVPDLELSYINARKVLDFKPFYNGFNRAIFVISLIGVFKNENYDHHKMIARLQANPKSIDHCSNVTQYKIMLEETFNFRSRHKVSLRF